MNFASNRPHVRFEDPSADVPAMSRRSGVAGIIFDVDGTLVDSNDYHTRAWQQAFRKFGYRFSFDEVRVHIGKGGDLLVPDLLDARSMRDSGAAIRKYRKKLFLDEFLPKVKPFPGTRDALERLRGLGIRLFLASSAQPNEVEHYVDLIGIEDLIDGSTSAGDADLSKPSPEIFQAALDEIPAPKSRTIIVGDTPYDILAGHRASTPVAAVRCGGFPEESLHKAEWIFDDVRDFVEQIESIDDYFTH